MNRAFGNAVSCPGTTALDAAGVERHRFSADFISGRLIGACIDGSRFTEGGSLAEVFAAPDEHSYLPEPGSLPVGRADPDLAPPQGFRGAPRRAPGDAGAGEVLRKTPEISSA